MDEVAAIKGLGLTRHGAGGDPGLPRSVRLEVPKFNGTDPKRWIFAIHEYFDLMGTSADQRLKVVGLKPSLQQELLVSKPMTLGEAFLLARVMEARLEDQGMSSVNNKTAGNSGSDQNQKRTTSHFSSSRQEELVKPTLLPTPSKPNSNVGTTPLAIKWISSAERQERLSKGLCFNCDNKWVRGHKCPKKFLFLMANEEEDATQDATVDQDKALKSGDISILNSLVRYGSLRSIGRS
ncbi:hypothetical protein Tco_0336197 [Tanacetum coccineum]